MVDRLGSWIQSRHSKLDVKNYSESLNLFHFTMKTMKTNNSHYVECTKKKVKKKYSATIREVGLIDEFLPNWTGCIYV